MAAGILAAITVASALFVVPIAVADYTIPLEITKPALASLSSTVTAASVGDGLIIVTNAKNNADSPAEAVFVVQVKNQYGFTETVSFVNATVAASGEVQLGVSWSPQMSGNYVIDVFAMDSESPPRVLSEKKSSLVGIEPSGILITIPEDAHAGGKRYSPTMATVMIGYNNTVTWINADSYSHRVRADNIDDPGFAGAIRKIGSLEPGQSFSYRFAKPGTYGFHENDMKGRIIVLPDPYEGYEKDRGDRHTAVELEMHSLPDPTLASHFLKGYVRDSSGRPIAHGNVNVYANGLYMGNATSDVEGCFNFQDWKSEPLQQDRDFALKEGKPWLDLEIRAEYSGDDYYYWSKATANSKLYFHWPPMPPPLYEVAWPAGGNTVSVVQGGTKDFDVSIRPYGKEYEIDTMILNMQRLPCAVDGSVSSQDIQATVDDPADYTVSLTAKDYAEPGRYFVLLQQDLTDVNNPYVRDPTLSGFWLEILPKR